MLEVTPEATEAIKILVSNSEMTDEAGVRIAARQVDDAAATLDLSVVEGPAETDEVLGEPGARLFVEEGAARFLDDKILDAELGQGRVSFKINERADDFSSNGRKTDDPDPLS